MALRPYALRVGVVVLLLGLLAVANMALPLSFKLLIDDVFPGAEGGAADPRLLWLILAGLGVIYVVRNVLFFTSRTIAVGVAEDMCFGLRSRLFEHLQQMSLSFYRTQQVGKLSSRVMDDTWKLLLFVQDKLPTLVLNALMLVTLLSIIYTVNWRLAIVSSLVLPLHFLTYRYFVAPIKRSQSRAQDKLETAYGSLVERFLGMEVVKSFAAERREAAQFDRAIAATRRSDIRTQRYHFAQKVAADLIIGAGIVALLGFGAWHVIEGVMSTGEFFMFFGYVTMLYPAVLEVLSASSHFTRASASVDRVFELFERRPTEEGVLDPVGRAAADSVRGEIEFRDVRFAYDDGPEVLAGLSLHIAAGEHVAVIGPSGAGKTTMASLIPRFNAPCSGAVLIDGRDPLDLGVPTVRRAVGMAFQEVFLFNSSLLENLLYARYDATVDEIIEACRITGAHDFIEKLPVGYGSTPSELGARFSRGEKQRITLARALLKSPRILVLDEATASLDGDSAAAIIRRVLYAMAGRTVIMITHDTTLASLADRVITIREGVVVDDRPGAAAAGNSASRATASAAEAGA